MMATPSYAIITYLSLYHDVAILKGSIRTLETYVNVYTFYLDYLITIILSTLI